MKDGDILAALSSFINPAGDAGATVIVDGMEFTDADLPLLYVRLPSYTRDVAPIGMRRHLPTLNPRVVLNIRGSPGQID